MAVKNHRDARVAVDPSLLEWAEYWYPISWKGVLGGGIITAVGACATIAFLLLQWRTTTIREEQSDWRTTAIEADTAKSKAQLGVAQADIAKANVQIAEANARALEARLALEKFKAPRKLGETQLARVKAAVTPFAGTPFDIGVTLESEPQNFAAQIAGLLESAGWVWKDRNNTPGIAINIGKHQAGMVSGGPPLGIEIDSSKDKDWGRAVLALGNALLAEDMQPVMNEATDNSASSDAVHLYFGSKR
jgi:hypothetical protein